MSNAIRYDSLLVHYLARELNDRLRGRICRWLPQREADDAAALLLEGGEALRFDFHPARGGLRLIEAATADGSLDAEITAVHAPPDERRITLELEGTSRFRTLRRRLVLELYTNQWNLLVLDEDDRLLFVLRTRRGGRRTLEPGGTYAPPPPHARLDPASTSHPEASREWVARLRGVVPEQRAAVMQRSFAYTGPINATALLGSAATLDEPEALAEAFPRWWALASLPAPQPVLLRLPAGLQPYPLPLPGIAAEPAAGLLEAMARAGDVAAPSGPSDGAAEWLGKIEQRLRAAERKLERLREQQAGAGRAERARRFGDLLLAHGGQVPRGAATVRLPDWDGGELEIALDPSLNAAENAGRWYDEARRQARAVARLPELLRSAEAEARRWRELAAAVREGRTDAAVAGALESLTPPVEQGAPAGPRLPYRTFRTSGGLEVRVGRSAADNDRLTFGHARPGEVWLHARSVAGSHVVLRWRDPEQAPPRRDLEEAAGLAAWFSKARTSGMVAVDWTRRKYVRKPRGAPPGKVAVQRVKTVFVEPDPALERRLAVTE